MPTRLSYYRLPNLAYLARRWPHSVYHLPHQLHPSLSYMKTYQLCLMAGFSKSPSARHHSAIPHKAVKILASYHDKVRRPNAYHNKAHTAQVILNAGLLAQKAGLRQAQIDLLIVAALIHDYDHLGYHRSKAPFWQELESLKKALPILLSNGMDARLAKLLTDFVMATSLYDNSMSQRESDNSVKALLLDADLFASLFSARTKSWKLTAHLKFEDRQTDELPEMIARFISYCRQSGFASSVAQHMHEKLPSDHSYL